MYQVQIWDSEMGKWETVDRYSIREEVIKAAKWDGEWGSRYKHIRVLGEFDGKLVIIARS